LKLTIPNGTQSTILNAAFAFGFLEEVERDEAPLYLQDFIQLRRLGTNTNRRPL
jgi:hypothetical protein